MNEADETLQRHFIRTMMPSDEGRLHPLHIIHACRGRKDSDAICGYIMLSDTPRPDSEWVTVQAIV